MEEIMPIKKIIGSVEKLPIEEKLQLIEQVSHQIQLELKLASKKPKKSLRGIWKGLNITEDEINKNRREIWGNFPRENF